jgi:dCMP deaminase
MERSLKIIKTYLKIASNISELSRCNRAKVGAILVKDKNIISYGYNGTPSGFCNECEDSNNITKPEVIHAETNAIIKAGGLSNGSEMFITLSPCIQCCKLLKQAGITHVYFSEQYKEIDGLILFKIPYTHVKI